MKCNVTIISTNFRHEERNDIKFCKGTNAPNRPLTLTTTSRYYLIVDSKGDERIENQARYV